MSAEKPVVFIVDDDRSMCKALKRLLGTAGLRAHTFGSAQEFRSTKRPDVPSCLVLGVRLPGLSGLDLQRRLVDMDPPMPIVIMTAYADIPMTVQAVKAGAVEFLTKRFVTRSCSTPFRRRLSGTARCEANGQS
jgi:FixJ family two-component response regulator